LQFMQNSVGNLAQISLSLSFFTFLHRARRIRICIISSQILAESSYSISGVERIAFPVALAELTFRARICSATKRRFEIAKGGDLIKLFACKSK